MTRMQKPVPQAIFLSGVCGIRRVSLALQLASAVITAPKLAATSAVTFTRMMPRATSTASSTLGSHSRLPSRATPSSESQLPAGALVAFSRNAGIAALPFAAGDLLAAEALVAHPLCVYLL